MVGVSVVIDPITKRRKGVLRISAKSDLWATRSGPFPKDSIRGFV